MTNERTDSLAPRRRRIARVVACTLALVAIRVPALAAETTRVSVGDAGLQANLASGLPAIDQTGRTVAFASSATNLVAGDVNAATDVFVRDRRKSSTALVSVASDGTPANGASVNPRVSRNGRMVAFLSQASNLVDGDANARDDVFVHDLKTGVTTLVSVATDGTQAGAASRNLQLGGDGRLVAFQTAASNLVALDRNGTDDVFVHDRRTGITTRVSIATDGTEANGPSVLSPYGGMGANGRLVAFSSAATNLARNDTNGFDDVFVYDRRTGIATRASVASDGTEADATSAEATLSENGRVVAFASDATNLVAGDGNDAADVFVHDLKSGRTERASVASDGGEANGRSRGASLSHDGRYVTFVSSASNLVPNDSNGVDDVFVHDRKTGVTLRVSVDATGIQSNGPSLFSAISGNGKAVVLQSLASNLVPDDTNHANDVFVRDLE